MMDGAGPVVDGRDDEARRLDDRIQKYVAGDERGDSSFDPLALELFAYQYEKNEPYRRYCDRFGRTPADARSWRDVPAVPASAFGAARLACFDGGRTALRFVSSGTTRSARPSVHDLDCGALYDTSLLSQYRARVTPDAASMRVVALAPSFQEAPHSSLSYMLSKVADVLGAPGGGFFIRDDRLDFEGAASALRAGSEPVVVFGTAFAFVHFFDRSRELGERFSLPIGSRVVETGGFKGRSREVPRDELYAAFGDLLGVPRVLCLSEYGMCELGSQWYDANLDDFLAGRRPRVDVKIGPHWARAIVVDPMTAQPVTPGDEGLIQIFDASNRGSVASILTADIGRERDGGIELLGRFAGAPPKGCSIAVDALLLSGDD
jgi:hypothetical protein